MIVVPPGQLPTLLVGSARVASTSGPPSADSGAVVDEVELVTQRRGIGGACFVGKAHEDVSGVDFKHGDLVNTGHKGIWVTPLYPGKHPLNTRVMKVELVPTTNIVLNWATRTEAHHFDEKLQSITVRSKDGFAFNLDVSQIIHVGALDAPKGISRVSFSLARASFGFEGGKVLSSVLERSCRAG